MPPTTIADDDGADAVPDAPDVPDVDAVVVDDELLQAAAASATAPTAAAVWILRMRLLDKEFPFAWLLVFLFRHVRRDFPIDTPDLT
jgi:hypothetical protein